MRLIGFVGGDAQVKTTKTQREFTVLSLATTASWKDKNGDGYIKQHGMAQACRYMESEVVSKRSIGLVTIG